MNSTAEMESEMYSILFSCILWDLFANRYDQTGFNDSNLNILLETKAGYDATWNRSFLHRISYHLKPLPRQPVTAWYAWHHIGTRDIMSHSSQWQTWRFITRTDCDGHTYQVWCHCMSCAVLHSVPTVPFIVFTLRWDWTITCDITGGCCNRLFIFIRFQIENFT